jgi:hypothetical protein
MPATPIRVAAAAPPNSVLIFPLSITGGLCRQQAVTVARGRGVESSGRQFEVGF